MPRKMKTDQLPIHFAPPVDRVTELVHIVDTLHEELGLKVYFEGRYDATQTIWSAASNKGGGWTSDQALAAMRHSLVPDPFIAESRKGLLVYKGFTSLGNMLRFKTYACLRATARPVLVAKARPTFEVVCNEWAEQNGLEYQELPAARRS